MDEVAPLSAIARAVNLSLRQREVLVYVAAGRTNAEIARELAISPRTVRMHCDALKVKLGVPKRRLIPAAYRAITGMDPFLAFGTNTSRAETNQARA
jgi:DNA-binding CsgD family transcriptional regulator